MANPFDPGAVNPFTPDLNAVSAADRTFGVAVPRADGPVPQSAPSAWDPSGRPDPVSFSQTLDAAFGPQAFFDEEDDRPSSFSSYPGLLSAPKDKSLGPTAFQQKKVNWSDGGERENSPKAFRNLSADFLETDYEYGLKEGAGDAPVRAANVFGRQFTRDELERDDEGRKLLDLMQSRRRGDYSEGGTLANLARGFGAWSKADIPYYGWISDIGASATEAMDISKTMRKLQDGDSVTPHEVIQARRYMLQRELESTRTAAYQIGSVARQAIPFMAEMFAESMAMAGIVGAFTGGLGAVPGAIAGAAIAPAKLLWRMVTKGAPKAIAKVTDREIAKYAVKGALSGAADFASVAARGAEVYGSRQAFGGVLRTATKRAAETLGEGATRKQIRDEAFRTVADAMSKRAPEYLSPKMAARMLFGADYRTGAETAITKGLEQFCLAKSAVDAADLARMSVRDRTKLIRSVWSKVKKEEKDEFVRAMLGGLQEGALPGELLKGVRGFSSASVRTGMEETTGLLVSNKYAESVARRIAQQTMRAFDLKYGAESFAPLYRTGRWLGEHAVRGLVQSEHAYFAGGLPTIGHAGFSSFNMSYDALKEGLGRVFVEAPIQGALQAAVGPMALSPIFAYASGRDPSELVYKGQLGFQANALLTGDRKNMETARQCAIGSLFVEYMSESAGRGLGLMAGGALASNPLARKVLGTGGSASTEAMTGGVSRAWEGFLSGPLTRHAGDMLSKAVNAVYGFGKMPLEKYASLATKYVSQLAKNKGIQVAEAEVVNAAKTRSFDAISDGLRELLAENGIRTAKQLANRVCFENSKGSTMRAIANVIGLKLAQRGLTPDEIVRKFRQMGKGGGIFEEMGEERLGDFVRGALHLDDTASDADIGEHLKSMFSGFTDPKQLMVEFFGFAWPGALRATSMWTQRFIMTGKLSESRERAERIRNVMDLVGNGRPAISFFADRRDRELIARHNEEGKRLMDRALGTSEANGEAVLANAASVASGDKAALRSEITANGGLSRKATTAADGTQEAGVAADAANAYEARVNAVLSAADEPQTVAAMEDLARSYMQYQTEAELEEALVQTGATTIFGGAGVEAIRREWRKLDGHRFSGGAVEDALSDYKNFMAQGIRRIRTSSPISFGALGRQVMAQTPVFSSDASATADQRDDLSGNPDMPLVDEGIRDQLVEDMEELARTLGREAMSFESREKAGFARKAIAKAVGILGFMSTGDISLAFMNPARWQARDAGMSPMMLGVALGTYSKSLYEGFRAIREGEGGIEETVRRELAEASANDEDFSAKLREMRKDGRITEQTYDAIEEAGREYYHRRMAELAEAVLAGSGILMVAQGQSDEAVFDYVASRHRSDDGKYLLRDGTKVDDPDDPRFRDSWAAEIEKTRDDLVDALLRLAGDRESLRYTRSPGLGVTAPLFAVDVTRAIRNGTSAEMMGAILSLPAFRNVSTVGNVSNLSEHERETLFSALNARHANLSEIADVDISKDLSGADACKVAYAMGFDVSDTSRTEREIQDAMKAFVRRFRLLREGGLTTFTDLDGRGREAKVIPEYGEDGRKSYRAVVKAADGTVTTDSTHATFADAKAAVLASAGPRMEEGWESNPDPDFGFAEDTKDIIVTSIKELVSEDATSLVFTLMNNDREALRTLYLDRIEPGAGRRGRLTDSVLESNLPPWLRKEADSDRWLFDGADSTERALDAFRREMEAYRFYERNKGNANLWGRGQNLTFDQRKSLMDADRRTAEAVKKYEEAGAAILSSFGVNRTKTQSSVTLGLDNPYVCQFDSFSANQGNVLVVSPDFKSTGDSEGMLRYGIRQALEAWTGAESDDASDRNLLLVHAFRTFRECGEKVAARYDRSDKKKARRIREALDKNVPYRIDGVRTSSIAAIASSSLFYSCDRGLRQEGNGFFDSPELAAVADEFRGTDVYPLFASAIDEALGGTGFFHSSGTASVDGLAAWADAFARDDAALEAARKSTVFGDGKSARNPYLVRYALRDGLTADAAEVAPFRLVRGADDVTDADGLLRTFSGKDVVKRYLKSVSDACVKLTDGYRALVGGGDGFRMSTAKAYRLAVRSGMCGGATTGDTGVRAKLMSSGAIRTNAVNEAARIEAKGLPFEITQKTAKHFGSVLRRMALSSGKSFEDGRKEFVEDLRERGIPEAVVEAVENAYLDTRTASEAGNFDENGNDRRKAEETDAGDEVENGGTVENHDEQKRIAGLMDNDDTTALSLVLRWYFPTEGGNVSATLLRVRDVLSQGPSLGEESLDALGDFMTDGMRDSVSKFLQAVSVNSDKSAFSENLAKSAFEGEPDQDAVSKILDDVTRVLVKLGMNEYAAAVAAMRDVPTRDGRRAQLLSTFAQMTVTDPMQLTRKSDFSFSLDNLGGIVESSRMPNAVQDMYASLLSVSCKGVDLTGTTPQSLAKGIADALVLLSHGKTESLADEPTRWPELNEILKRNWVGEDGMADFDAPSSSATVKFKVAVAKEDVAEVSRALSGRYRADEVSRALDRIQDTVWKRMQNMADAVDLLFGYGSTQSAMLRSRDTLAYVRRAAESALSREWNSVDAEFAARRRLLVDDWDKSDATKKKVDREVAKAREIFDARKAAAVNRLFQLANYFSAGPYVNKNFGEWNVFSASAFLSDLVQEPLVQLARRFGAGNFVGTNGYVLERGAYDLRSAIEKHISAAVEKDAGKFGKRRSARAVVRGELRSIGMMKAAVGKDISKGLTPAEMDVGRDGKSMYDPMRVLDDQNLATLVDSYVSSLPQSGRSIAGHVKGKSEIAKNRSMMTLPSDLPADIRMEAHALFTDVKIDVGPDSSGIELFHGSAFDFGGKFENKNGYGTWFTNVESQARQFSWKAQGEPRKNDGTPFPAQDLSKTVVGKYRITLRNPKVYEGVSDYRKDAYYAFIDDFVNATGVAKGSMNWDVSPDKAAEFRKKLESQGYDGILIKGTNIDDETEDQYVVFDPKNIHPVSPGPKSLAEILAENGGRWADGSRLLVSVVGAKDVDGTLVPKEYLAGILDETIRREFSDGNPTHVLMPFFRADKPSCFAIRMPVRVATEWVKQVAGNEKLMANLKPELAERIRGLKDAMDGRIPQSVLDEDDQVRKEFGDVLVNDAVKGANTGMTVADLVRDVPNFYTAEESKQIEEAIRKERETSGKSSDPSETPRLRVVYASRATDPVFYAGKIVEFLRKNAEKPFTDPTRCNALEIWSKHDGAPMRRILEACREYKCAPIVSFSITTLGDTAIEKGVLKYDDLVNLVGGLIERKLLVPSAVTVRVDPILAGVTDMNAVKDLMTKARKLGIRKFVTSMTQSYDYDSSRSIVGHINKCVNEMTGADYDWEKYYGTDPRSVGKARKNFNFTPKAQYIRQWAEFFQKMQEELGVIVQSCSMQMFGLKPSACLDPAILSRMTGTDKAVYTEDDGGYVMAKSGMRGGRRLCECFAGDSDLFNRVDQPCHSMCAYCYAGQFGNPKAKTLQYYNEDGTLFDRPLTRIDDKKGKVESFHDKDGKPTFLSNMFDAPVEVDGIVYKNVEAAFQAQKEKDPEARKRFADMTGKEAKAAGRAVQLTPNEVNEWNDRRTETMYRILQSKFDQNPELMKKLLATQGFDLEEGNTWGDVFWGTVNGKGENNLGKLLMKVRDEAAKKVTSGSDRAAPENVAPEQVLDRDSLYRAAFGLAMTAAGQADIDPKRVATTLSVGPFIPLYRPKDDSDKTSACYFVSVLGGTTAASLTGGYLIGGCGSENVRRRSERVSGSPVEAEKLHVTAPVGAFFKKGQANDFGFGFDADGWTTTEASVLYYQAQGRREIERILGLKEGILDPVREPENADDAKMALWKLSEKNPHDDAVAKAKEFLKTSTLVVDDLETNKAGIFGSSCGFAWDGKSEFSLSFTRTTVSEVSGKSRSATVGIRYTKKNGVTDLDGNRLSGGWNVEPDAKKGQMPIMWALSALCMATKDGKLTNADIRGITASFRLQNGKVTEPVALGDADLLSEGDEFSVRDAGGGNAVFAYKTRNAHAQIVANNANPSAPEYDHSFATNATRDMEMLEELANVELSTSTHRFVDAHAGYTFLQMSVLGANPTLVSEACAQDPDVVEAYREHPDDPEVRDAVAQKVCAFLRKQCIVGFYGAHGVMCPSAGNGHTPVSESRGSHTVKIEWLPGTTQYDKDIFRPARIYGTRESAFYGKSRDFGSGCVNVRSRGFRYGMYLDEAKFAKFCESEFFTSNRHVSVPGEQVNVREWGEIEGSVEDAKVAANLIRAIRIAAKDKDAHKALLGCFVDYTGRSAAESEGSKDARFDDLFEGYGVNGKFDCSAIGIGRWRRNSPNEKDSKKGSIYLAGSHFCAHRSPSGNIEAFQGTVRATAPVRFHAKTGEIGKESKYALDPVTMLLQGSDTDGDSAGLQFYDYGCGDGVTAEAIAEFSAYAAKVSGEYDEKTGKLKSSRDEQVLAEARKRGWTEVEEYYDGVSGKRKTREIVREDVLRQFTRAAFAAQVRNYERAETFHQGQTGPHGVPEKSERYAASDVWSGAEFADKYNAEGLGMTRELDGEFVCDYGWAGRQPVGTDAVWDEPVSLGSLSGLSARAKRIFAKMFADRKTTAAGYFDGKLTFSRMLEDFVDAAEYQEKTDDLLDPEKSAMLSDAAADSAKARGVSVFHQSRFLRALAREVLGDASLRMRERDGYSPLVDLISHFDGISNNLFDTLKKMFATRAGWTQQMLPFLLGRIVVNATKRMKSGNGARLGNAFVFVECANFLAELTNDSVLARIAAYTHPTKGRKAILDAARADAEREEKEDADNEDNEDNEDKTDGAKKKKKKKLKVNDRMSAQQVAELFCRVRGVKIREPGKDYDSTPRGKEAIIMCASRMGKGDALKDPAKEKTAESVEAELLAIQRTLDDVRQFGEQVDYVVGAGRDVAGFGKASDRNDKLVSVAADTSVQSMQERVVGEYASLAERFTDSYDALELAGRRLDAREREDLDAKERKDWYEKRRVNPIAEGVELGENHQRLSHLIAVGRSGAVESARKFGNSTVEFVENFADAVRYASNSAWAKHTGRNTDRIASFLCALTAKDGRIDLRSRTDATTVAALRRGFAALRASDGEFGLKWREAGEVRSAKVTGQEFAALLLLHASATRPFGASTSYVGQSNLPAAFGDDLLRELETAAFLLSRKADGSFSDAYVRLVRKPPVSTSSGVKAFDFMSFSPAFSELKVADAATGTDPLRTYEHLTDNFGARHLSAEKLTGDRGERLTVTEDGQPSGSVSPAFGTELPTRTEFSDGAGRPRPVFRDRDGNGHATVEEAYNAGLASFEAEVVGKSANGEPTDEWNYYVEKYRSEGNRAEADATGTVRRRLRDIVAEAASSDEGVYTMLRNAGRFYVTHPNADVEYALNEVANMIDAGKIAEPSASQTKARMASELGGNSEDAGATRADFLDRVSVSGFRGASPEQLKKTIPQAIADGFRAAFGNGVEVSVVEEGGRPTNLLKVVRKVGGKSVVTYVSYGDTPRLEGMSRNDKMASLLDMVNSKRRSEGRAEITAEDLDRLSGHDVDALLESFKLAGLQVGESRSAGSLGFAPVMSGVIRLSVDAGFDTLFHEYFHQMLACYKRLGVYGASEMRDLKARFSTAEGDFDEEAAADAYARFLTGSENGWDEVKLRDYVTGPADGEDGGSAQKVVAVFERLRRVSRGLAEALSRGPDESGMPVFVYATMVYGDFTEEQLAKLTDPTDEQLREIEHFLLHQEGQFALTSGMPADRIAQVHEGAAAMLEELCAETPDAERIAEAVRLVSDTASSATADPMELPDVNVAEAQEETYETKAGKVSAFLRAALTRFRRDGGSPATRAALARYARESLADPNAGASDVVYAARRLLREVAAAQGIATEDAEGNLNETGRMLLSDHAVAELAMRLIANTDAERGAEVGPATSETDIRARRAGADYTFARALEHVSPNAYWRYCTERAEAAKARFVAAAERAQARADALSATGSEADAAAARVAAKQASELRGLALRVVELARKIASGSDLHDEFPSNRNSGNLHGLAFKTFAGGAAFGEDHSSRDGISRYDGEYGSSYSFDIADPAIAVAFDYAATAFFVAEAARKYNSVTGGVSRDRAVEGVGEVAEEASPAESPAEEPVSPELAEGGSAERASEMSREVSAMDADYGPYEMAEAYDTTPDWILSNPGTWLFEDLQKSLSGTDMRGMLTDHSAQAACEEAYQFADMFNQTFGLDTWVGDKVREMTRTVTNLGTNDDGDFAYVQGRRAATVFSNVKGAALGMIAWGEKRVGSPFLARDLRMSHWACQTVKHLAARERYHVTGVEVRSVGEADDVRRITSDGWKAAYSPSEVIRRYVSSEEARRTEPVTALDVLLYRVLVALPEEVLGASHLDGTLSDNGGFYHDLVNALREGALSAKAAVDESLGEIPDYQGEMVSALRRGGRRGAFARKGGDGRVMIAVPVSRSVSAWKGSDAYAKLTEAKRTPELLDLYYWANQFARQYNAVSRTAAKSRYLNGGMGSNVSLAGTSSYWFYGGTGSHAMNVSKYQNALKALEGESTSADDELRKNGNVMFSVLESISRDTLNRTAFSADGSTSVSPRAVKYLAYLMGVTDGHNDASFDVADFSRRVASGEFDNDDYGTSVPRDAKVADVYMLLNRLAEQKALDALARGSGLTSAEKREYADALKVSDRIARALAEEMPGTVNARTEEQEFAATGRLGDSATAGETLVKMCREVVTAERFRAGLAQMLVSVGSDGTPNYVVNPTDEAVAAAGMPDEYWGALARFVIGRMSFKHPVAEYDEGLTGIQNMRAVYESVRAERAKGGADAPKYHDMDVRKLRADKAFAGILCTDRKEDPAGNSNALTDFQKGEADCYMRQLFSIFKAPSANSAFQKLDRVMSWTKIMSVGFSAFFDVATVFESATAAVGFWHTAMGMTKTGARAARRIGRAVGRKGGTGAFTSDAVFMSDLAEYVNSDDPFVRRARELCDLIGMPLDRTFRFVNDRDDANPALREGGIVKADIERVVGFAHAAGWKPSAVANLRKTLRFMYEAPTDYTFNVVLNAVKMSVVMQTMRRLREECVRGGRPFDPIRELRRYSDYINAEIGGIDPSKYAWATPEMRKVLSLGMFSWQWTVGAWVAGGGEAVTDAVFGGHSSSQAVRQRAFIRWLRMLGIVKFGVPVVLQAAIKALSTALAKALPPDDEAKELEEEIDRMPWFCPLNESKVGSLNFDVTPLLKLAARVPGVRAAKEADVPFISALVPAYVGGGRNTTGSRRYYMHFGKQSDEFFRWFSDPLAQFMSKLSVPLQKAIESVYGQGGPQSYRKPFAEKGLFDRFFNSSMKPDENAFWNAASMATSFSAQSVQSNPDAGFLAAVGPIKMGESKRSVRLRIVERLGEFVSDSSGGNDPWDYGRNRKRLNQLCTDIFREAQLNGVPPDRIMSSALGDVRKVLYAKLMDALPKDPRSSSSVDAKKAIAAVRALFRLNAKYRNIKSSVFQKYEDAGVDLNKSPAMRRALMDFIRAAQENPAGMSEKSVELAFDRYFRYDEALRRSVHVDDKGGENFGNFLATDDVPPTLFGVPVVTDGYSEEDLAFFRDNPEAGGFYDLGDGKGYASPSNGGLLSGVPRGRREFSKSFERKPKRVRRKDGSVMMYPEQDNAKKGYDIGGYRYYVNQAGKLIPHSNGKPISEKLYLRSVAATDADMDNVISKIYGVYGVDPGKLDEGARTATDDLVFIGGGNALNGNSPTLKGQVDALVRRGWSREDAYAAGLALEGDTYGARNYRRQAARGALVMEALSRSSNPEAKAFADAYSKAWSAEPASDGARGEEAYGASWNRHAAGMREASKLADRWGLKYSTGFGK